MVKKRLVYPVEGRWIDGVPHVAHDCDDPFCVESGAFTTKPPPKVAAHPKDPPEGGSSDSTEA
jgi:hypothetical protein